MYTHTLPSSRSACSPSSTFPKKIRFEEQRCLQSYYTIFVVLKKLISIGMIDNHQTALAGLYI